MTHDEIELVLAYHRRALEDLGTSVLLLSSALTEAGRKIASLEATVAIHEFALYPDGRPEDGSGATPGLP